MELVSHTAEGDVTVPSLAISTPSTKKRTLATATSSHAVALMTDPVGTIAPECGNVIATPGGVASGFWADAAGGASQAQLNVSAQAATTWTNPAQRMVTSLAPQPC